MSGEPETRSARVRLRSTSDRKKALDQYQEMRRMARTDSAVIIVKLKDDTWQVLGQNMSLAQISEAMTIGASAVLQANQQANRATLERHQEPARRGIHNGAMPRAKEVTYDAEGNMIPPPGENVISCGECSHPRWYVLLRNEDEQLGRYVCASCGNEVKGIRLTHDAGHA